MVSPVLLKKYVLDLQDLTGSFDSEVISIFLDFLDNSLVFHFAIALIFSCFQKTLNDISRKSLIFEMLKMLKFYMENNFSVEPLQ